MFGTGQNGQIFQCRSWIRKNSHPENGVNIGTIYEVCEVRSDALHTPVLILQKAYL